MTLSDNHPAALARAHDNIYPSRYGVWGSAIELKNSRQALAELADAVFIGTPSDSHIKLAKKTSAVIRFVG